MSEQPIVIGDILKGKAWVFGDNINTDIIIPFRFKSRTNDPYEMAKYAMYGFDPDFHKKISNGDMIVAGKRSEEHTSELQSQFHLVCRLLLEKKKKYINYSETDISEDS